MIDTTAKSGLWSELSPFILPGGPLYGSEAALRMENAWQYAKLYAAHATPDGEPTVDYWRWAREGWADPAPHRYPMGRGARPLCSLWEGRRLGYIEARKKIYTPLYARAVVRTKAFEELTRLHAQEERDIYLRDWDGYDHLAEGVSIAQVIHDPKRKMGHAFVLWALLTGTYGQLLAHSEEQELPQALSLALSPSQGPSKAARRSRGRD